MKDTPLGLYFGIACR